MDKKTETILKKVKPKQEQMKIYAMLIKTSRGKFLWIEAAYSLEVAFGQAKMHLTRLHPEVSFGDAKIDLFNHETAESLFSRSSELTNFSEVVPSRKLVVNEDKNAKISALMKEIVENKDLSLFEKNRPIFSEAQTKFLEDKLKKIK